MTYLVTKTNQCLMCNILSRASFHNQPAVLILYSTGIFRS